MSEPEWSDFKIVLALARGASVAGAARVLGVDGSTISRRLAAIEEALGTCLIIRGGREFAFTPAGKVALEAAQAIEAATAAAACAIRAARTDIEGVVKISCVPSVLRILMPVPAMVSEKHPKLSIELNAAARIVDLAKGEADIAIRMVRPSEIDVIARRAFEWGGVVCASKAYAARHGLPQNPDELRHHALVLYVEQMLHLPWFRYLEPYANKGAPVTRVDSTEMAYNIVAAGAAIGVISSTAASSAPDILRVFPNPVASSTGWIVYHETARNSARIKFVVDTLCEYFASQESLISGVRTGP